MVTVGVPVGVGEPRAMRRVAVRVGVALGEGVLVAGGVGDGARVDVTVGEGLRVKVGVEVGCRVMVGVAVEDSQNATPSVESGRLSWLNPAAPRTTARTAKKKGLRRARR